MRSIPYLTEHANEVKVAGDGLIPLYDEFASQHHAATEQESCQFFRFTNHKIT